ncbi:hypothetical protein M0534_01715 [Methylonatrum kenyense]|uniref:hypothetical protein n=1 Tax=Methylonatrum kenyense TaxID=455253 RepID=UPI0020C0D280|nr:hypothetical protein [Methylonatrum kenyense]MCK8515049.1 hypothetical protein [Methylonatrum kenyense]
MNLRLISGTLAALILVSPAGAMHDHAEAGHVKDDESVGVVTFQPDCEEASARAFDRALAFKHHMMYEQARGLFRDLAETDPACAMGHWGVAATWFQPLWPGRPDQETLEAGRQAIERAREADPGDARELALIDPVAAFFEDDAGLGYRDRMAAWADGMAAAYAAHPDDLDVASLYGLSRLALAMAADTETRNRLHDEAETVLRNVWQQENAHPGAVHYAIHATDADGRAENALAMVESYADIAPNVPHALHMPSHIYVRLGAWDEVIHWNRRSADVAIEHDVNGAVSFHYIHAMDYLVYGYLQQGDVEEALAAYREAIAVERHQAGFASAFHLAAMPARLAVEQRDWAAARDLMARSPDYLAWEQFHWPQGMTWYARGLGAMHTGEQELADEAEQRLATLRERARDEGEDRFATYIEVDRLILAGWMQHAAGDAEQAVSLMQDAAELEATVEKDPITPGALYPPYEALGDLLLLLDRPEEALEAYQSSDGIWPGRRNTLAGMEAAREETASR